MHTPAPPARKLAALVAGVALAVTACGSGGAPAQQTEGAVQLSVSLFGTFGYQETGLFAEYEKQNPGVTIKYDSTQSEDAYWPALQTRLASGKGSSDVEPSPPPGDPSRPAPQAAILRPWSTTNHNDPPGPVSGQPSSSPARLAGRDCAL